MKTIKLTLRPNGSVGVVHSHIYETENLATTLLVDYSAVTYVAGFLKYVSLKMGDNTAITLPAIGSPFVGNVLSIQITNYVTKLGSLSVQAYAEQPSGGETTKVIFQPIKLNVEDFIYGGGQPTPPPIEDFEQLKTEVAQLRIDLNDLVDRVDIVELDILDLQTETGQLALDKVDKVTGKSLIDDAEILRLSTIQPIESVFSIVDPTDYSFLAYNEITTKWENIANPFEPIDQVLYDLQNNKADLEHVHDDRYYPMNVVDSMFENVTLDSLYDVTVATPLTGDVLIYNELTEEFENSPAIKTFMDTHVHDDRYFTETEVTNLVNPKMNLDGSNSDINTLTFDVTPADTLPLTAGEMRWNSTKGTPEIGLNGGSVIGTMFEETYYPRVKNLDTVTIVDGDLVMFVAPIGNSGVIGVKRCNTPQLIGSEHIMGIATEHIAVNALGRVTWFGMINGIQTNGANYGESWVDGEILYNHPTILGGMTKVRPPAPAHVGSVASVVNSHVSNGQLLVRPQFFPEMDLISNVNITNALQGDMLMYNFTTKTWDNTSLSAILPPKFDDITFELTQSRIGANLKPDYDYTNLGLLFPQNLTTEIAYITVQLPHKWKEGSTIYPHVHVRQAAAQQAVFKMDYKWYNIGDLIPAGWTTLILNVPARTYVSGSLAQLIGSANGIVGTGKTISSVLKIKLYRDDNVYTGDMLVDQFDVHIEIDSLGSTSVMTK